MGPTVEIENAARLTGLFGHWPSFHDAEIIGAQLRAATTTPSSLELEVEVAEMSSEIDGLGIYRDRQRCRAVFRFENVSELGLLDFAPQNVLNDLQVRLTEPRDQERLKGFWGNRRYYVRFEPIAGFCEIELYCDRIEVLSAVVVERSESPEARRGGAQALSKSGPQPAT